MLNEYIFNTFTDYTRIKKPYLKVHVSLRVIIHVTTDKLVLINEFFPRIVHFDRLIN